MSDTVILTAAEFDYLEMLAMVNGGVGAYHADHVSSEPLTPLSFVTRSNSYHPIYRTPCCILGLAGFDGNFLSHIGINRLSPTRNDSIVGAYLRNHSGKTKMPWKEYVKAYPLSRGQ